MTDREILVATRVMDLKVPYADSVQVPCEGCQQFVWVEKFDTLPAIAQRNLQLLCSHCVAQLDDAEIEIEFLPGQEALIFALGWSAEEPRAVATESLKRDRNRAQS